jgi:hypothetical protein
MNLQTHEKQTRYKFGHNKASSHNMHICEKRSTLCRLYLSPSFTQQSDSDVKTQQPLRSTGGVNLPVFEVHGSNLLVSWYSPLASWFPEPVSANWDPSPGWQMGYHHSSVREPSIMYQCQRPNENTTASNGSSTWMIRKGIGHNFRANVFSRCLKRRLPCLLSTIWFYVSDAFDHALPKQLVTSQKSKLTERTFRIQLLTLPGFKSPTTSSL